MISSGPNPTFPTVKRIPSGSSRDVTFVSMARDLFSFPQATPAWLWMIDPAVLGSVTSSIKKLRSSCERMRPFQCKVRFSISQKISGDLPASMTKEGEIWNVKATRSGVDSPVLRRIISYRIVPRSGTFPEVHLISDLLKSAWSA